MLVVVASRRDRIAAALVECWAEHDAQLLTPDDLSVAGWQHMLPRPSTRATAVVCGKVVETGRIAGVLTRLPAVVESDLPHIAAEDRGYVASEMTAFLIAWLASLTCPVVNRPTAACLAGPGRRAEGWVHLAGQLGIPVRTWQASAMLVDEPPRPETSTATATATVVGNNCFGEVHETLRCRARRLARAAGADLLAVHFSDPGADAELVSADIWPDLGRSDLCDAVLAYLLERGRQC